jgi:hypothetical protein
MAPDLIAGRRPIGGAPCLSTSRPYWESKLCVRLVRIGEEVLLSMMAAKAASPSTRSTDHEIDFLDCLAVPIAAYPECLRQ